MAIDTIWVVVERSGETVAPVSLELASQARRLASQVEGITWGDAAGLAAVVGAHGMSALHSVGDLGDHLPGPAVAGAVAARAAAGSGPDAIFVPHDPDGRDIAARLSVRLDRPVLTNVVGLRDEDGDLRSEHAIFGGRDVLTARFDGPGPGIYVVRAKSFPATDTGGPQARLDHWDVPDLARTDAAVVTAHHVEESEGPRLDEAAVVVSGGRGLGDAGNYQLVERLARLLGGAAGASRAIVDAEWVPYARQVGQTGRTVKPDVYIAVGISGATQHMVGMKASKHIVAINTDRDAPILSIADLGVVGDARSILPRLIEALERRS